METLVEILSLISAALLYPVLMLLMILLLWSLVELGGFIRELKERWECRANWSEQRMTTETVCRFFNTSEYPGLLGVFSRRGCSSQENPSLLQKLQTDLEIEASRRLAHMSFGIRIGPILGLMGTLIPLSPALLGLSAGNLDQLAQNLVVAFSTTVLGLFIAGICYGIWLTRRQWYAADLANVEYICQSLQLNDVQADHKEIEQNERQITNECASTIVE